MTSTPRPFKPMGDQLTSPQPLLDNTRERSSQSARQVQTPSSLWRSLRLDRLIEFALRPPVILLTLVTVMLSRGITDGEFFFYGDEMRHAMNGAFFRDFIFDHPLRHPLQYVYEYYAKYPALAFPHWPPLFSFVEGVFFLLFGLSPWVSRLAILGFALLAVYFWYRIAERLGPRYRAFLSAVILASMPFVLLYERVTMLEIPALAACLGVIHFWLKFIESERRRDLWVLAGFVVGAFLISQKAIFLLFFVGFDLVMERRFRLLKRVDVWLALLASALAILPWYLLASRTMSSWSSRLFGHGGYGHLVLTKYGYTFYLTKLYGQLGPVLLLLACAGLVLALVKRTRADRILLVWVISGYICFTLIIEKDPRHTMLWVPPLLYLALTGLETLMRRRALALIATTIFALVFLVNAVRSERPKLSGVEEVARYVVSLPESEITYYQGDLDGDFIFFVRKFDPEKEHMVAREKQIVVSRLGWSAKEVLHTPEEVLNFFQTWGIRYAVVEDQDALSGLSSVRELLNSGQFELLRSFPVSTNQPNYTVHQIQVFRYRGELHRTQQAVAIPMMTIRNNIPADLSRLAGRPWPD
jgi:hypothetical protein